MPRINHIAIKVDDLAKASELYENVFGLTYVSTVRNPGRVSRNLTDGAIYLTLIQYEGEDAPEARFGGDGCCIHHFGIEVDAPGPYEAELKARGYEILSGSSDKMPVKFRPSTGVCAELLISTSIGPEETKAAE
ncbi:MAG TPA: VOC family protein [Stellaceae bacterium]|jgi:catechol 2,3-dioxygenase-like lactoylglutathione lyase family enzyme|nr:VOC family protein [Stellaceae bacterium]